MRDKAFATFGQKMPKRCVVGGCSNTANQEEGISVHEIPFWGEESPVLAKRRGKWEKFVKSTRQYYSFILHLYSFCSGIVNLIYIVVMSYLNSAGC